MAEYKIQSYLRMEFEGFVYKKKLLGCRTMLRSLVMFLWLRLRIHHHSHSLQILYKPIQKCLHFDNAPPLEGKIL
jgi:hypothetical protein